MTIVEMTHNDDLLARFICRSSATISIETDVIGMNQILHCEFHIGFLY
jgi:hypothetical protein